MKIRALFLLAALPCCFAQTTPKPIDSLWFMDVRELKQERMEQLTATIKQWESMHLFDAYGWRVMPPSYHDPQPVIGMMNSLNAAAHGKLIAATVPAGTEGWETSFNSRLAQRNGGSYDASKAIGEADWLKLLEGVDAGMFTWVLEQPARMPKPEQAARSARAFVSAVKTRKKKVVIWLSAQALGPQPTLIREVCAATKDSADFFAWMDVPEMIAMKALGHRPSSAEEGKMTPAMLAELDKVLDAILELSPREKTVMQWINSPMFPTQDAAGTSAYIAACQKKGIGHFVVLGSANLLDREPWGEFYRSLVKVRTGIQ